MNRSTGIIPRYLVWLLPFTYSLHIVEEYFAGGGLPNWFSNVFNATISNDDFILINTIALSGVIAFSIIYQFFKQNNVLFLALVTLFFANGIIHLLSSIFSLTYSPGTVTGLILYIPVGIFLFKRILPLLSYNQRVTGISIGIFIHIIVAIIAFNV
jgi:hypothetical protein